MSLLFNFDLKDIDGFSLQIKVYDRNGLIHLEDSNYSDMIIYPEHLDEYIAILQKIKKLMVLK